MKLHVPVAWFAGGWIACCLAFPCAARVQADDDGERLKDASNEVIASPRYEGMTVITHPSPEDLEKGFTGWAKKYPQRFTFETRGKTPQGRPILMVRAASSDPVPDSVSPAWSPTVAADGSRSTAKAVTRHWRHAPDASGR